MNSKAQGFLESQILFYGLLCLVSCLTVFSFTIGLSWTQVDPHCSWSVQCAFLSIRHQRPGRGNGDCRGENQAAWKSQVLEANTAPLPIRLHPPTVQQRSVIPATQGDQEYNQVHEGELFRAGGKAYMHVSLMNMRAAPCNPVWSALDFIILIIFLLHSYSGWRSM